MREHDFALENKSQLQAEKAPRNLASETRRVLSEKQHRLVVAVLQVPQLTDHATGAAGVEGGVDECQE